MSGQGFAAVIAFAAGVIATGLGGWFNQRLERRKHIANLAGRAFLEAAEAFSANQQCEAALVSLGDHMPEEEKRYWRQRIFETRADFFSAKARLAVFGNSEITRLFAAIERRGGLTGNDEITRQLSTEMVQSFRKELGFKENDISGQDLAAVLFGPVPAEREKPSVDGLRGWPPRTFTPRGKQK